MKLVFCLLLVMTCHWGWAAEAPQDLMKKATALCKAKKPKEAAALLKRVLESKDANEGMRAKALQHLGACQLRLGQEKEAVKTFSELITKYPDYTEDVLKALRHLEKAQAVLELRSSDIASSATSGEDTGRIRRLLKEIVVDHIEFEDAPVSKVFKYLKQVSKKKDKERAGVNFLVALERHQDLWDDDDDDDDDDDVWGEDDDDDDDEIGDNEPTITMDFDKIPLGEAVRYICEGAGLKYRVEKYAVVIRGPSTGSSLELRFFTVDQKWAQKIYGAAKTKKDINLKFRNFFEDYGLKLSERFGADPTLSFDVKSSKLIAWAPPEYLRLIEMVASDSYAPEKQQCRIEAKLVEIFPEKKSEGRKERLTTGALIEAAHKGKIRAWAKLSVVATHGKKAVVTSVDQVRIPASKKGKTYSAGCKLQVLPRMGRDLITTKVDLSWECKLFDPQMTKTPVLAKTVSSNMSIWDGESQLFQFAPAKPEQNRGALYLIVRLALVDPGGITLREQDGPDGRLEEALRLLLKDEGETD